jgi:Cu/Ag efflux protein CusF
MKLEVDVMRAHITGWLAAAAAVVLFTQSPMLAQKPVSMGDTVSATFTIEAIDHATRTVTLKDKAGLFTDVVCGPDVQRFDALKVGDQVTFRYHESLVTIISRPGAAAKAPASAAVTRTPGTAPGGTIAQQMTAVVTLEAIDAKTPAVTIRTQNGRRMSVRIENAKNLEGYKVGDQVEITYTQALAVSVTPAK